SRSKLPREAPSRISERRIERCPTWAGWSMSEKGADKSRWGMIIGRGSPMRAGLTNGWTADPNGRGSCRRRERGDAVGKVRRHFGAHEPERRGRGAPRQEAELAEEPCRDVAARALQGAADERGQLARGRCDQLSEHGAAVTLAARFSRDAR